jgi:ribosomal protein S24E
LSFEVVEEHTNTLLGRREAKMVVHHEGAGTPDRLTVRKLASEHFKTPVDRVFVKSIATRTGGSSATCMVEIYADAKNAAEIVPAYLKNRMLPKDQRVAKVKKEAEPKPAAPAPKPAAKKEEAKPAEKKEEATKPAPAKEAKPAPAKETKPAGKEEKPAPAKEAKPAKPEKPKT